ncbi:hypothetical protein A0O34_15980 [Chryseobacterium glaciei]|uniref:Uncharacterized protein n=1 Tax=Chryseobacterium glaciei TaxID=1685010 RepID=A0A172XY24_9FLAO|nr:hypothetical protein [Chryseobacterium glaciei]ANF51917.1 hypothetical protein A0O34_15980 [Chryseobacterium glaciei]
MKLHEHYSSFLGEDNIYKNISTIKRNTTFDLVVLILIVVTMGIGVYFFTEDTVKNKTPLSETYYRWHFILMVSSFVFCYGFIFYERVRLFKNIKQKVGKFKQNMLEVILFGIDWDSKILKYYWFEKLHASNRELETWKLEFFKIQNDKDLATSTAPKFPINLSEVISIVVILVSVLNFISFAVGAEEGRQQKLIVLQTFLLVSPIFFPIIMFIRNSFNEKKNNYKNMQNYSLALGYVLDKRRIENGSQQENLSEE